MSWSFIFLLAAIVFFNRYLFLEPKVAIQFPMFFERMLKYSAPCLLSAICIPIIFFLITVNGDRCRAIVIFMPRYFAFLYAYF